MMGARTRMLVGTDGDAREILRSRPQLDRAATAALARRLFPDEALEPLEDGSLEFTAPPNGELMLGVFPGLVVVAAEEFTTDFPSQMPPSFLDAALGRKIVLHSMFDELAALAFAVWQDGELVRSLSVYLEDGIVEEIGERLPFEQPYWEGQHPFDQPEEDPTEYPLIFDPTELGNAALREFFGYQLPGQLQSGELEPESIPLMRFQRSALQ